MAKSGRLSIDEKNFIQENCFEQTDEEISQYLGRNIKTVRSYRKKLGVTKGAHGTVESANLDKIPQSSARSFTEDQKVNFFQTQLKNSFFYQNLKEQFTEDEIGFYLEEWGALCVQFEDIIATEKRQIDELIKAEVMANRILRNVKIVEDEICNIQKEIDLLRAASDLDNDEDAQDRDNQLLTLVKILNAQAEAMTNNYQRNVSLRNSLLNELNARRRDRVDQITKKGSTVQNLIEQLRDKEVRNLKGRYMELVRIAREKKKDKWRKPIMFPDGSKDCVLMDEESQPPSRFEVINDSASRFFNYFKIDENKNILIIDDDSKRQQFFADKFRNHTLDFSTNASKAIDKIKHRKEYDLICLDYDLGFDQKCTQFVEFMLDKKLCKKAKFIIHSMNEMGAKKLHQMLYDERDCEVVNFEELLKEDNENAKIGIASTTSSSDEDDATGDSSA